MEQMESLQPEINELQKQRDDYFQKFLMDMTARAVQEAKKGRKKALRILIPAVIVISLVLIGIGIVIGKYIL